MSRPSYLLLPLLLCLLTGCDDAPPTAEVRKGGDGAREKAPENPDTGFEATGTHPTPPEAAEAMILHFAVGKQEHMDGGIEDSSSTRRKSNVRVPLPIMRHIVETDWQTSGSWIDTPVPPYPEHPSDEFVRKVWEKCECFEVDLNHDGLAEIIVEVNVSPGVTGNTSFHVIVQQDGQWRYAGELGGTSYQLEQSRTPSGYSDIVTLWKNGGGEYTVTTYRYHNGRYQDWRSHIAILREGGDPLIRKRKEYPLK